MVTQTNVRGPLAPIEMPDGVTVLSVADVAYLLTRHDSPAQRRSNDMLGFSASHASDALIQAGASSLLARGLGRLNSEGVVTPLAGAAMAEYVTMTAGRWLNLDAISGTGLERTVVIVGKDFTGAFQLRALGTMMTGFAAPSTPPEQFVLGIVRQIIEEHPEASIGIAASDLENVRGSVFVRWSGDDGAWDTVDRTSNAEATERTLIDDERLSGLLGTLIAGPDRA